MGILQSIRRKFRHDRQPAGEVAQGLLADPNRIAAARYIDYTDLVSHLNGWVFDLDKKHFPHVDTFSWPRLWTWTTVAKPLMDAGDQPKWWYDFGGVILIEERLPQ